MTEYELKQQFYEQFNTVVANWAEWTQTPQATIEIMRDPWKGQAPEVTVRPNDAEHNRARDILTMLKNRHTGGNNAKP
jgi:hypothetical protein